MKYHITTFGCEQNSADSERIAAVYEARGFSRVENWREADVAVINTCMVRKAAEDRVYGLAHKMKIFKQKHPQFKLIVTGCMVGAASREPTGTLARRLHKILPQVDEFLPIEEVGFAYQPVRKSSTHASVPITHGCNNYCAFCIVPYSRGTEVSRPYGEIMKEIQDLAQKGYTAVTLLGQNVNSYGADLVKAQLQEKQGTDFEISPGRSIVPVLVKHLGRTRIPTLFPYLLEDVAQTPGLQRITFLSANPWDYSDELIDVIARNPNIERELHLPIQAGDNEVLRRMNRWYTKEDYLQLIEKIKEKVPGVAFTTDIIVGFPGETAEQFEQSVDVAKKVRFNKAFIAQYSSRPGTRATREMEDDVPYEEKVRRFRVLDDLINT